jgi:hypothetical protein
VLARLEEVVDAVDVVAEVDACTACSPRHWSHRARADRRRHTLAVWIEDA